MTARDILVLLPACLPAYLRVHGGEECIEWDVFSAKDTGINRGLMKKFEEALVSGIAYPPGLPCA